ncbi:MAG: type II toxin-antitoxin system RelE/ParE family toxin [Leptospirales bacterium]
MKRVFGIRTFIRWKNKSGLSERALLDAVSEMERGMIDADLGGNVLKKRIALPGRVKRGSARVIVATKRQDCCFFLYGFEKNERDSIDNKELEALQKIGAEFLNMDDRNVTKAIEAKELVEVFDDTEER